MKETNPSGNAGFSIHMNRRSFLTTAGTIAAASNLQLFDFTSSLFAAQNKDEQKPLVRVAFVRPNVEKYWMGWPGAAYDIKDRQKQYTKILTDAARQFDVDLDVINSPIDGERAFHSLIDNLRKKPPHGLIVVSMCLHHRGFPAWKIINNIAKAREKIPTIIFSPMGTSFTNDLHRTRNYPQLFLAATQDLQWLNFGLRMLNAIYRMKTTRICICKGKKTEDETLDVIGTTLHYVPSGRFLDELQKVKQTPQVAAMADFYQKNAKKIVEPDRSDLLTAAKNYVACRNIMKAENCNGFSMDCLPLVSRKLIKPPCLAFSRLRDEGGLGTCEADTDAAISTRLINLLFDRPGFMQDPAPNTIKNTLMGAHCCCATKLDGFSKPPSPFILRTHSESNVGVATQVLWRAGQKITIMKFAGPEQIIVGTGTVVQNIDTPPAGGCRTSLEVKLDNVANSLDTRGFHQLFVYGDLELPLKAYCQLAGIKSMHL